MRYSSAWKGFLSTATLIGAALFSVTASATGLIPLPSKYDPATGLATFGVSVVGVADQPPTGHVTFYTRLPEQPFEDAQISDGMAVLTLRLRPGAHHITATYLGDQWNTWAQVELTVDVPVDSWVPALIEHLLSD